MWRWSFLLHDRTSCLTALWLQDVRQRAIFVRFMGKKSHKKLRQEEEYSAVAEATCAKGLSLGEYTAQCFADAISFEDGIEVTKVR